MIDGGKNRTKHPSKIASVLRVQRVTSLFQQHKPKILVQRNMFITNTQTRMIIATAPVAHQNYFGQNKLPHITDIVGLAHQKSIPNFVTKFAQLVSFLSGKSRHYRVRCRGAFEAAAAG